MKKSLFKKAIITTFVVVTFIMGVSLVVMYYLGDRLLEEAIKIDLTDISEFESQGKQTSDVRAEVSGGTTEDQSNTGKSSNPETSKMIDSAAKSGNSPAFSNSHKAASASNKDADKALTKGPRSAAVEKQITAEKIKEIKDKVSPADKIEIAAMVLNRLSPSDIDELKKILVGGVTAEEKERAKQIAYSRFTKDEIIKIQKMYVKYIR